jgi:hypothetical protein
MTIEDTIQLGEPVEHRGVVIAPLFPRRQPQAQYVTLEEALPLGLRITEIDWAGSVPELLVVNPLDANVLLYDGEELVGAKQNRILNVTVLVAERSETRIPVSCVEEGRWASRSAAFAAARQTAYPELRRHKAQLLSAEPLALGLAQSEVWSEVRSKMDRLHAASPTGAQADAFKSRDDELARLRHAFPLAPGQSGAVFALGEAICLDYVSRGVLPALSEAARRLPARRDRASRRPRSDASADRDTEYEARVGASKPPTVAVARRGRASSGQGSRRIGLGARRRAHSALRLQQRARGPHHSRRPAKATSIAARGNI